MPIVFHLTFFIEVSKTHQTRRDFLKKPFSSFDKSVACRAMGLSTSPMSDQPSVLVWMDLEFSGLSPDQGDVILEIATIITNSDLELIAEGPTLAIHQSDDILNNMDEWNTKHHNESGLVDRVRASRLSHEDADEITSSFVLDHCEKGVSPLCGNSIHQDRRFLYRYMPKVSESLHYRNIDVSTIKELARRWTPAVEPFKKKKAHLALDDIKESIEELRYLRKSWNL